MSYADYIHDDLFIPVVQCRILIDTFERAQKNGQLSANPGGDPYWNDRFLWYSSIPSGDVEPRLVLQFLRSRIVERIRVHFGLEKALYSDNIQIVHWPTGIDMPPHADNSTSDGLPNEYPYRDYGAIVYLNDNFEGGEFYFPRLGVQIRPKAGALLAFPGGLSHLHGVRKVITGERYTVASWYTHDPRYRDRTEGHASWP